MIRRSNPLPPAACFVLALLLCALAPLSGRAQAFSKFIVFGDSLSDTGNDAHVAKASYDVAFPGPDFNYTASRFTNGSDTNPPSTVYAGVWHEQLAKLFFGLPAATNSLANGLDFAYGGATTQVGTAKLGPNDTAAKDLSVTITIDNMGKQVTDYLANNTVDPKALYIVWGGANDLFNNATKANAVAAADREMVLVRRLAHAGVTTFLVPNLPPLGATPDYNTSPHDEALMTGYAMDFNQELSTDLNKLQKMLGSAGFKVKIYQLDVFGLFTRLIQNQYAYGFTDITDSAQGVSVKADKYLFWDGVHPTVAGHYQLAAEAYTLISGKPVVEINALPGGTANSSDALSIFYLTRTGTDLSTALPVGYTVGGTAQSGTDYVALTGRRQIMVGKQTGPIFIDQGSAAPSQPAKTISLKLVPSKDFTLPVLSTATVKLLPQP